MADVFVSYARVDKHRVVPLVAALESQRWSVWWDPEIIPGQEFDELVARELGRASAVLVVWTRDSVQSRWVRGEAREGADRGVLVPVRFDNAVLPIDFRALHTIDLDQATDLGRSPAFEAVVRAVSGLVAGQGVAGPAPAPSAATLPPTAAGSKRIDICVLPFANAGGDPEQEFFADGMTGDVITELARWRMLSVRPLSAANRYRGGNANTMQVARELNVRYVVEGSVRRIGDRVRISVQLVDAESGEQAWADRFDRAQAEIFAVQDELVRKIVGTVVGRVQTIVAEQARRKPPASLAAYECVQRGNALPWDDPEAAAEATRLFEQAVALDPGYAIAHALLGTMRIGQWRNAPAGSDAGIEEAYALCKRAVELDDSDSTCHSLLAHACLYRRAYELALMHMRRSVEINPNNAWNRADMGLVLTYAGPAQEALDWLKSAREIDPYFDPPWYWRQSGQAYMVLRRFEEALAMFELVPLRTVRASAYIAACHARLGGPADARPFVAECLAANPAFSVRHFMSKEPFRHAEDAAFLGESLRLAGFPE
ncbi:MAG TPA: TIR domain-containing protein [Steroidobacteraceae bacterium]|nr:TIR domain-containing protein [Steroidobacteraceae bacterium]